MRTVATACPALAMLWEVQEASLWQDHPDPIRHRSAQGGSANSGFRLRLPRPQLLLQPTLNPSQHAQVSWLYSKPRRRQARYLPPFHQSPFFR